MTPSVQMAEVVTLQDTTKACWCVLTNKASNSSLDAQEQFDSEEKKKRIERYISLIFGAPLI
jgi:hypothetical protein